MTLLAQHLSTRAHDWLKSSAVTLSPDGEVELQALLSASQLRATHRQSFTGGQTPAAGADLSEVEDNLTLVLQKAAQLSGGKAIDAITLQQARLSLCPLFPFC
jgi:hypothetical protein